MTIRLFLAQPTIVFAARVNQTGFFYPIAQVTFDTVGTGAFGDIEPGMTVLFGSSAGADDYGRQRIRKAATATVLYFGRSSEGTRDGEVDLADDAHITVLDDYRVWSKIPYIATDGTIYKDNDIPVGTLTTTIPPVANAGAAMAGTIDSGTSKLRVTLPHEANTSFAVSGAIASYAWVLPAGVALVGGYNLTDSQIEVDCDPGFYWVKLTVTDSNAETHTTRVPIYARDASSDTSIGTFTIENHRITQENQRLSVRILEDIAESTYPDGTLVMIWEDEPANGADRSHMLFTGWHQSDPATLASQRTGILRDTVLELLDVAGRLDTLPGFSGSVEVAASPSSWSQMTAPNMDKYLHYLLHWHSTALEVADWSWTGTTTTYPFVVLGNAAESLWDQALRRAKALVPDYVLGCNTLGQLQTVIDPLLQDTGSRTATIQATLAEADWLSIRYTHQRPPRVHWLRGEAIVASATTITPIFCITPGETPGQGETANSQGEQLAVSQTTLNACEGHRYARYNAPERYFSIVLAEGADKGLEPSDMTWLRLNVSSDTAAQRGLALSNERGLVREMNIRYDHARTGLVKQVEILWERETSGTPAVIVNLPDSGLPDPEWEPPNFSYDPIPDPTGYELYSQFFVGTDDGVAFAETNDVINESSFNWTAVNTGLADTAIQQLIYSQELGFLYAVTGGAIERTALPLSGASTWTELIAVADIVTACGGGNTAYLYELAIDWTDPLIQWLLVDVEESANEVGTYTVKTTDGWATWAASARFEVDNVLQLPDFPYAYGLAVGRNTGTLWATGGYYRFGGAVFKSTDSGATWTYVHERATTDVWDGICVPDGDASDNYVFAGIDVSGGTPPQVQKSLNGGASFTGETVLASGNPTWIHWRVGFTTMYVACAKDVEWYNVDTDTFESWWPAGQMWTNGPAATELFPKDARCVGWGTNNRLGYVIAVGDAVSDSSARVHHYDDAGNVRDISNNLTTVLGSATTVNCIGWEGGELDE